MNFVGENILIYNGENLPEDLQFSVTQSIKNLFNSCKCIYEIKIERSKNCIWYILSKNIPEYMIVLLLQNAISKAYNAILLQNALIEYPNILFNSVVNNVNVQNINIVFNNLYNISTILAHTKSISPPEYDILD